MIDLCRYCGLSRCADADIDWQCRAARDVSALRERLAEARADTERLEFLIREGWYEYDGSDWRSEIDESIATSQMGGSE